MNDLFAIAMVSIGLLLLGVMGIITILMWRILNLIRSSAD